MLLETKDTPVIAKTKELCELVLQQESYQKMRGHVEAFVNDTAAQDLYQNLLEKQEYLRHKQEQGVSLTDEEIADFEKERDEMLANEVCGNYLDAQKQLFDLSDTMSLYISKTIELGRVPEEGELKSGGCCGGGCGGGGCS